MGKAKAACKILQVSSKVTERCTIYQDIFHCRNTGRVVYILAQLQYLGTINNIES